MGEDELYQLEYLSDEVDKWNSNVRDCSELLGSGDSFSIGLDRSLFQINLETIDRIYNYLDELGKQQK